MSAQIPETKTLKDLLKPTGFDCPEELQDKTFAEATSGGGGGSGITIEPITITQNGTTTAPSGKAYSPITVNVPASGSGSVTLYAWYSEADRTYVHMNIAVSPKDSADVNNVKMLDYSTTERANVVKSLNGSTYTRVSDTEFNITRTDGVATFERDSGQDLVLWG